MGKWFDDLGLCICIATAEYDGNFLKIWLKNQWKGLSFPTLLWKTPSCVQRKSESTCSLQPTLFSLINLKPSKCPAAAAGHPRMRNNHTDEAVSYTLLQFGKLSGKVKLKKRSKRQKSLHYINSLYKIINKNYFCFCIFLHVKYGEQILEGTSQTSWWKWHLRAWFPTLSDFLLPLNFLQRWGIFVSSN